MLAATEAAVQGRDNYALYGLLLDRLLAFVNRFLYGIKVERQRPRCAVRE
jgi:hypothetical protein